MDEPVHKNEVSCPKCAAIIEVPRSYAGKKGRCACGEIFTIAITQDDTARKVPSVQKALGTTSRRWAVGVALIVVFLGVAGTAWWIATQPRRLKTALIETSRHFDGKEFERVEFWVGLREAGHISWVELDKQIDNAGLFGPVLSVSKETQVAYRNWRAWRSAHADPPRESARLAKARLVAAIKKWDAKTPYLSQWITNVESGKENGRKLAPAVEHHLRCSQETVQAFSAWVDSIQ